MKTEARVRAIYDRQLRSGRLTTQLHQERTERIRYATELRSLRDQLGRRVDARVELEVVEQRVRRVEDRALVVSEDQRAALIDPIKYRA